VRRLACVAVMLLAAGCKPAPEAPAAVAAPAPPVQEAPPAPAVASTPVEDPAIAWENRLGNLPPDTASIIRRVEACTHFSGEFNGDRSERDREVAAKMDELHCASVEADVAFLRDQYGDRPDVIEALDMAVEGTR
jgi:hypothetical protein